MPNVKSAIKRVEISKKKTAINKSARAEMHTYIKKLKTLINEKKIKDAEQLLIKVFSVLDNSSQDSVIHKNKANRIKSHLSKLLDEAKGKKTVKKVKVKESIDEKKETKPVKEAKAEVKKSEKPKIKEEAKKEEVKKDKVKKEENNKEKEKISKTKK